jgi:hypothetical protein
MQELERIVTNRQATVTSSRIRTIWVTGVSDGAVHIDHAVPDEEMMIGQGEYAAVCGAAVHPAPLTVPPGRLCGQCVTFLQARAQHHERRTNSAGRQTSTWLARIFGWRLG